jgi:hypothetical protein
MNFKQFTKEAYPALDRTQKETRRKRLNLSSDIMNLYAAAQALSVNGYMTYINRNFLILNDK